MLSIIVIALSFVILFSFVFPPVASEAKASPLRLNDEERRWIAENPDVSIGVVADNEPYSFYVNGQIMGWTIDVLDRITLMTGLNFQPRMGSWAQIYGEFRQGSLDAVADISKTDDRSRFIDFTPAYHLRNTVLFHNIDRPLETPDNLDALKKQRIGIIQDIFYEKALRSADFDLVEYATYRDLVAAVAFGWVDAALAPEMTGQFFIHDNGFSNVAKAGSLPLAAVSLEDFRIGVIRDNGNPDQALLHNILSKAIDALPNEELESITERWLIYRSNRPMGNGSLRLLPEEQAFLEDASPIRIGFMADYEPFSFLENGRGQGLAVDLAQYISSRTGLVFEPVFDNWSRLLEQFRSGEIDVITNISYTPDRAEFTLFSDLYHRIPNAVFVRSGFGVYSGLEDLEGQTIGITRDVYYADEVAARFKHVVEFGTQDDLMQALSDGLIDAAVTSLSNGNAIVRRLGLINIEIGGEFTMDDVEREDLRFGVTPDYPYLASIIDKSLESVPLSRWQQMEARWLGPPVAGVTRRHSVLTPEERAYLREKGVIRVCVDPVIPPYVRRSENGELEGAVVDIMNLMAERGGFEWQAEPVSYLGKNNAAIDATGCDVLPFAARANMAGAAFDISLSYLDVPLAVASALEAPFVESLRDLNGQKVGIVPAHAPLDMLQVRYPYVELEAIQSESAGLNAVLDGRLDAVVGPLDGLAFLIATMDTNAVKISGRISETLEVVVATSGEQPFLGRIFDKLVAGIDRQTVETILARQKLQPFQRAVDYRVLAGLTLVIILVVALVVYWNRKLARLNKALNNANQSLHEISITDGLTGLFNRGHFMERAARDFELSRRNSWRFTLAMIDVDHFKPINDREGHIFGDRCLGHLGEILKAHFRRGGDLVARYGGEEFIALTLSGDAGEIARHLERLRQEVEASPVASERGYVSLTISVGFYSAVPGEGDTLDHFTDLADQHLYAAKKQGRNRVVGNI